MGKSNSNKNKVPLPPPLKENIPVFMPRISDNTCQSPAPESPGVTAASRAFPRKRHMYRLYFYYSTVWRMRVGEETTSLQWALTNADKQGWFEPYTNRWVTEKPRRTGVDSVPAPLWQSATWQVRTPHPTLFISSTLELTTSNHKPPPLWQLIKCSFCLLLFHWFILTWL